MNGARPPFVSTHFLVVGIDKQAVPLEDVDHSNKDLTSSAPRTPISPPRLSVDGRRGSLDASDSASVSSKPAENAAGHADLLKARVRGSMRLDDSEHLSRILRSKYKPAIIDRYPRIDRPGTNLPRGLPLFCFPNGLSLQSECPMPTLFRIILTDENGGRLHGSILQFHEGIELSTITDDDSTSRMVRSLSSMSLPIERYIANFVDEIPLPPRGKARVQVSFGDRPMYISRTRPNKLPAVEVRYQILFQLIRPTNILTIVNALLLEQKVLLVSRHLQALSDVSETLLALLFPFQWEHVYIPLIPSALSEFVAAPTPFLMGMSRHCFIEAQSSIPADVYVVDLEADTITMSDPEVAKSTPSIPDKLRAKFLDVAKKWKFPSIDSQTMNHMSLAFPLAPLPSEDDTLSGITIKEAFEKNQYAFFRIFLSLLQKYRDFLVAPDSSDPESTYTFKERQFVSSAPSHSRAFLSAFVQTSLFCRFIEMRTEAQYKDCDILFFDESIDAKHNRSALRLSKKPTPFLTTKAFSNTKTVVVPPPSTDGVPPNSEFSYETFPKFQYDYFPAPRHMERLVNNENTSGTPASPKLVDRLVPANIKSRSAVAKLLTQISYGTWLMVQSSFVGDSRRYDEAELSTITVTLDSVKNQGLHMEEPVYRCLVEMCGRIGAKTLGMSLLKQMSSYGMTRDSAAFRHILQTAAHEVASAESDATVKDITEEVSEEIQELEREQQLQKQQTTPSESAPATPSDLNISNPGKDNTPGESVLAEQDQSNASVDGGSLPDEAAANSARSKEYRNISRRLEEDGHIEAVVNISELQHDVSVADTPDSMRDEFNLTFIFVQDECPLCSKKLDNADIKAGWDKDPQEYRTRCNGCENMFVARFKVVEQHSDSEVWCECLSPLVIRKELGLAAGSSRPEDTHTNTHTVGNLGYDLHALQELRTSRPSIFWNFVWHSVDLELNVSHLLPKTKAVIVKPDAPRSQEMESYFTKVPSP